MTGRVWTLVARDTALMGRPLTPQTDRQSSELRHRYPHGLHQIMAMGCAVVGGVVSGGGPLLAG